MWGFWQQDDDPSSDPTFVFDTISNETLEVEAELTEHAVEDPAEIGAHVVKRPRKIMLAGSVTPCVLGDAPAYKTNRVADAIGALDGLTQKGQPVVVVCSYWSRSDMVITAVSATNNHMEGERLQLTIEMSQASTVTAETVQMPLDRLKDGAARRRGSQSKDGGGSKQGAKKGAMGNMIKGMDFRASDAVASGIGDLISDP